jgi:hypothetical protein
MADAVVLAANAFSHKQDPKRSLQATCSLCGAAATEWCTEPWKQLPATERLCA